MLLFFFLKSNFFRGRKLEIPRYRCNIDNTLSSIYSSFLFSPYRSGRLGDENLTRCTRRTTLVPSSWKTDKPRGVCQFFPSDSLGKSTLDRGRREKLPVPLLLGKIDSSRGMEKK